MLIYDGDKFVFDLHIEEVADDYKRLSTVLGEVFFGKVLTDQATIYTAIFYDLPNYTPVIIADSQEDFKKDIRELVESQPLEVELNEDEIEAFIRETTQLMKKELLIE